MRRKLASVTGGKIALIVAVIWLLATLALGGATRQAQPADGLLQGLAALLAVGALWYGRFGRLPLTARLALGLAALLPALVLLQLVPLPAGLAAGLGDRSSLLAARVAADLPQPRAMISMLPDATLRAALAFLPPVAMVLIGLQLAGRQRRLLIWILVGATIASLLLGLAQIFGGPDSALRWHPITNLQSAVGPFANRNHLASLVALSIPIAAGGFVIGARVLDGHRRWIALGVASGTLVLLLLGLALVQSRAGVLLGGAALIASLAIALGLRSEHARDQRHSRGMLFGALAVAAVLIIQFALLGLLRRFEADPFQDRRFETAAVALDSTKLSGVAGAGAGAFVEVFAALEPAATRDNTYANRAHNDFAEWWLEGGVIFAAAILAVLGLWLACAIAAFRPAQYSSSIVVRRAAVLALAVLIGHCALDYPLRTTALGVVAALLATVAVMPASPAVARRPSASVAHS